MTLLILSILLALGVSFLCSLAEATLLSLSPSQVAAMSERHPRIGAIWQRFKADIERPIAVILTLNTAGHTIGASVAGAQYDQLFGGRGIWVFSILFTLAMLMFTEILPKSLGVRFNRRLGLAFATPLRAAVVALSPLLVAINWINRPWTRGGQGSDAAEVTPDEIAALAGMARWSNQITEKQERIIRGTSRLSELRVRDVMISTDHVSTLSTSQSIGDAVITAHIDSHTRYPVCEQGDRDKIIGYVNFKEMVYFMRMNPKDQSLRGVIRPVAFVDADDMAADLIPRFVDQHVHLAIVRDADGHTLGMVTLEDIMEQLVGDLEDEFDRLPRMCHALSGGVWMVGGGLPVHELAERLDRPIPFGTEAGTVSIWVADRLGRTPEPGDKIEVDGLAFMVRRVRRGKAYEVAVSEETQGTA